MLNALNTKLLCIVIALLTSIAGTLAYQSHLTAQEAARRAAVEAEHQRFVQEVHKLQTRQANNWGHSATTLRDYRSK